jgi:hypothetical protein
MGLFNQTASQTSNILLKHSYFAVERLLITEREINLKNKIGFQ